MFVSEWLIYSCILVHTSSLQWYSGLRWYLEVSYDRPKVPVILVGTKLDLRDDQKTIRELDVTHISYEQVWSTQLFLF